MVRLYGASLSSSFRSQYFPWMSEEIVCCVKWWHGVIFNFSDLGSHRSVSVLILSFFGSRFSLQ